MPYLGGRPGSNVRPLGTAGEEEKRPLNSHEPAGAKAADAAREGRDESELARDAMERALVKAIDDLFAELHLLLRHRRM